MNVFYEGDRIYFRPLEPGDEPLLRRWVNDPQNWATLKNVIPRNELREREWIEKLYQNEQEITLGICVKDGDRLVGCCGFRQTRPVERSSVLGILIGEREYQNRGIGTDAVRLLVRFGFGELNLNRISLTVLANNERGIRVYEKVGFVREGRARQAIFRGGRWHDELQYGLLREEWSS